MNIDPLADTAPPRHAVESDDEEDEYNILRSPSMSEPNQIVDVKIIGNLPSRRNLFIATGDIAKYWARGTDLGEQSGTVAVNGIQVGLVFNPNWTDATIIVSEVLTRLPVWAMHKYARTILDTLMPPIVSLLDVYPVPLYITTEPVSQDDAPLRYLATPISMPSFISKAEEFSPPNLLQSTSASFLSILNTTHHQSRGVLILVPSPHISHPSPRVIMPSNYSTLAEDRFEWSQGIMNSAQQLLFGVIGNDKPPKWENEKNAVVQNPSKQRSQVGEGGMYI